MFLTYFLAAAVTATGAVEADERKPSGTPSATQEARAKESRLLRNRGFFVFRLSLGVGFDTSSTTTETQGVGESATDDYVPHSWRSSDSGGVLLAEVMAGFRLTPQVAFGPFLGLEARPSRRWLSDNSEGFVGPEIIVHPWSHRGLFARGRFGWLAFGSESEDTLRMSAWMVGAGIGFEHEVLAGPTIGVGFDVNVTRTSERNWGDFDDYESRTTTVAPTLRFIAGFN